MKKGFTLIELLVVIAIIGVLTSVVFAALDRARNQSNDTKRISDMLQIKTALELYYNANSTYPVVPGWQSECSAWGGYSSNNVIPNLVSGSYMPSFPSDPQMNAAGNTCCYLYYSNGTSYKLLDHNCPSGGPNATPDPQPAFADPVRDSGADACVVDGTARWAWAIWSDPASQCW